MWEPAPREESDAILTPGVSPMGTDRFEISAEIRRTLHVVRRGWWIVAACVVVAAAVAYAVAARKADVYQASAQLLIQPDASAVSLPNAPGTVVDPTRARATALQLVTIGQVAERVAYRLHPRDPGASVTTASSGDSDVVSVNASDRYPKEAAALANAYAASYIAFRRQVNQARYLEAAAVIRNRLAHVHGNTQAAQQNASLLHDQINRLNLLADTQAGDAQLVQPASVPFAAAPNHRLRYALVGALFGLIVGLGLAFLRDRLQGRISREEDLADLAPGVPVIGYVPGARGRAALELIGDGIQDLCTSLQTLGLSAASNGNGNGRGGGRSILVTSATAQDGKSTTALNLALALEQREESVLLVEADLRRPKLSTIAPFDARRPGLSKVLTGKSELPDARQMVSFEPARGTAGAPFVALSGELPVVAAGRASQKPQVIISERSVEELLTRARQHADHVVIDGPPIGMVADMLPFARQVDGVLAVVRLGHTRPRELRRMLNLLQTAGVKPMGLVVVGAEPTPYYH